MPDSFTFLLVRLQMEKEKLLGWAILAKIATDDDDDNDNKTAGPVLRLNRHTVIDTLREIQVLLLDSSQLRKRYKLDLAPVPSLSNALHAVAGAGAREQPGGGGRLPLREDYSALQKRALSFVDKTRRYPGRLRWAAFDKAQFERLLSDLQGLNDSMMRFLDVHERNRHFQMQEATFMQILQLSNRMDDLFALTRSLRGSTAPGDGDARRRAYEDRVIRMTRFKAVSIAVDAGNESAETNHPGSEIALAKLGNLSPDTEARQPRSLATLDGDIPVWVEWRYYEGIFKEDCSDDDDDDDDEHDGDSDKDHPGPPPFVAQRISRLARLLGDREKPSEFLVPECVGYVHDKERSRFGFVFKSLDASPAPNGRLHPPPTPPTTLLELLSGGAPKPSLTTRIRIARTVATSIWYLHATNWLHKGLRSENVVFGRGSSATSMTKIDIRNEKPFLCGFDYSRPADPGEETERPVENLLHDMYRHPKVQFDLPREGGRSGFNKLHDVYSLGVVLFEIAVWKPVYEVLGVDDGGGPGAIKAAVAKSVESRLLAAENVAFLEAEAGDAVASAVRACLDGSLVDEQDANMLSPDSNAQLQLQFGERVVRVLDGIAI